MSDDDFDESGGDELSASGMSLSASQNSLGQSQQLEDEDMFGDEDKHKDHDKDYEILTAAQVLQKPLEMIAEVNELFQIDASVARQLLQHSNWNSEKLVNRYFAGEKEKLFAEAKIPTKLGNHKKPTGPTTCSVCFDVFAPEEIFGLPCDHFFCKECYSDYLQTKINTDGQADITCPARDCFLLVDEVTATKLLPEGPTKERYLKLVAKAFVRDNKFLRGCPAPGCGNFAKLALANKVVVIHCSCGEEYCSGCGNTSHRPCDCAMMKAWNDKMQSDSESSNWLKLYTRACPKCKAMISKDGGCQYMRCQTCHTAFCWLCMGLFDHKNHDCNRLELGKDASEAAKSLQKWEHFSKRYASHAQAITLQAKLIDKAQRLMQKLEDDHHKTWIEVVFIMEATKTVLAARKVLKDTYVYGFFLPEHVNRVLFEHLQGQLESKLEELSQLIEQKPELIFKDRLKIIDLEKTLKQNLQNVLAGLEKNDVRGAAPADKADWDKDVKIEYDGWVYNAN